MNALHCAAFVAVFLSALTSARAQDAPAPAAPTSPTNMQGTGQGAQDPLTAAEESLKDNKFVQGYNKAAKRFVAIGVGSLQEVRDRTNSNPTMEDLANARLAAFQLAMQSAKQKLAEFVGAEITSAVKSFYEEPDLGAQRLAEIPGASRVKELVDQDVGEPSKRPLVMTSEAFDSTVKIVAIQEVGALQAFQTFEHVEPDGVRGSIVVIAMLSPNSKRMQEAMLGKGGAVKDEPQGSTAEWLDKLEADGRLMFTQGVVQRVNEKGEVTLVAFSQASPRIASGRALDNARNKAEAQAKQMLRQFAGELVASSSSRTIGYSLKNFADASQEFLNNSDYKATIDNIAAGLALPGMAPVKTKSHTYPATGNPMVTCAVEWNVSSAMDANELGAALDKVRGSKGGTGLGGIQPKPPEKPAAGQGNKPANPAGTKPVQGVPPTPPKKPASGAGGTGSGG